MIRLIMRLFGPMFGQVAHIHHCLLEEFKGQVDALFIISGLSASGYIFQFTFRSLSDVSYSDVCQTKELSECVRNVAALSYCSEVL